MLLLRFFLLCLLLAPSLALAQTSPPNILLIIADDLGYADLGSYGNDFIETPHLDLLARQGMRFTQAYAASPVCSPTRASLQTGYYPARLGMNMIINPHRRPWAQLTPPANRWNLPDTVATLAEALQPAGYVSTIVGKWNLGYASPDMPTDRGYLPAPTNADGLNEAYRQEVQQFAQQHPQKNTGPITLQAIRFMEDHSNAPFLCVVSYFAPHIPMEVDASVAQKYEQKRQKQPTDVHPRYAAMVEVMDKGVGHLLKALETLGLADNTVVFFASDNGGLIQVYHECGPIVTTNAPLRSEKGTLYEGGIRIPMIVRWPETVDANTTSDVLTISHDLLPTFLAIAGETDPVSHDGQSLVPALTQAGTLDRALYWHYPTYHHATPAAAIRQGDYKLIHYYEDNRVELFDLAEDVGELQNLAADYPERAQQLRQQLADWQQSVGAAMPTANPNYNPSKAYIWGVRPEKPWMEVAAAALPVQERCKLLETDGLPLEGKTQTHE